MMGDPALDAQKVVADAGWGALTGGIIGTLFESGGALARAMVKAKGVSPVAADAAEGLNPAGSPDVETNPPVVDAPEAKAGVQPTSIADIQERVKNAAYNNQTLDMPQKAVLLDASSRVPLENPVHQLQLDSLSDQGSRDAYKTALEMPGEVGNALRDNETLQRNELNSLTDKTIQSMSPDVKPTSDAVEGGNRASDAFTEQYQAEKKELGPIFQQLKETPLPEGLNAQSGMLDAMTKAVPGTSHMFEASGDEIHVLPYKTSWGIDKATYSAAKEAMDSLAEGPVDFEQLQNIRKGLDQHVDVMAQGKAPSEIRAMKAGMMDYMQDAVQQATPDVNVREAFKRYAINETERGTIEKAFGAKVGAPDFGIVQKGNVASIGDKIFSRPETVEAAKKILQPNKFNEVLSNWVSEAKSLATKDGVFSSNKFGTWMTKNQDALKVAFEENPEAYQRLKDINTITRILPDSPSVNPSGTAKTLFNYFKNVGSDLGGEDIFSKGATLLPKAYKEAMAMIDHYKTIANIDAQLKGVSAADTIQSKIAKSATKITNQINENAKGIFTGGITATHAALSLGDFDKNRDRIQELASNPDGLSDHVNKMTAAIHQAAPDVAQGISSSISAGVQYLNSKIPRPVNELPMSPIWHPSTQQKKSFNDAYSTVNDPLSVMKKVKDGTLNSGDMEALQMVHPNLLDEMRMSVMNNIDKDTAHKLPSGTKMALSKFLGQPMSEGMMPDHIQFNQAGFIEPPGPKATVKGMKNLKMDKRAGGEKEEA
jgi:hypothetical protein